MNTVKIQVRWAAAHLGQDRRLPGVVTHSRPMRATGSILVRRRTRKQMTCRPDSLRPEIWKDMSEAWKRREKQKWAIEKPRLDNARILRGIYFIDPTNEEFMARRKLEVPMPAAMLCRTRREEYRETCSVLVNC